MIYEKPSFVTGNCVEKGLKKTPKGICKDRYIGKWEVWNVEVLFYQ
ncbi:hypothetical protein QCK_1042 [Clostridioides difficile CD45]|nr:hypothetical protein QCK_1042 [Clostridioides difficile CD45]EQF05133.1 hypothetical protein QEK_1184 [Clostridioides difficile CD131]EQG30383.1 hypothetical protein QIK_1030 [Clostridioides difficile DA00126]EQG67498.1 hypothetical protein QK1_1083 [Clostridioides difficile DA00142]EQG78224.1 hypothetical protein QKA_0666 [Clostridioides difficile DA00165]EQG95575.1 hypothetical protein QKK_1148 [Clostridioides difficile DA00191]EQH13510.1 hypothetical protein QKO_1003 [Clostridioides dif